MPRKNNWDNPKPAYAATSEQWTKFTGLRASPNYLRIGSFESCLGHPSY